MFVEMTRIARGFVVLLVAASQEVKSNGGAFLVGLIENVG